MINIYNANTSDFDNNGLTSLNEAISCVSTQELNKTRTLELEYPLDKRGKFLNLKGLNIIKAGGQLYRIPLQNNIQASGNSVKVTANHIFYDLANDFNDDVRAVNKSVHDALAIAIAVNPKFTVGECDDLGLNNADFIDESPTVSIYDKILTRWGGELDCDNFKVAVKTRIGIETGILISYGKNIQGFNQTLDWSQLATRIKLKGKDGLVVDLVNNGSSYIVSPRVNDYPFVITKTIKFENIEDATELLNAGNALWGVIDLVSCNFKVVFADLAKTVEYEAFKDMLVLNIGDTVIIRHKVFGCDLSARVIKIIRNEITDIIESLELGQFKSNIANTFYTIDKQMQYVEESVVETKADLVETNTKVFQNTEQISLQATAIDNVESRVSSAELKITADAIVSTVTSSTTYINEQGEKVNKATIISEINQTAEEIKISANRLNLIGYATFTSLGAGGSAVIDGGNITGGTIKGTSIQQTNGEIVINEFSKNGNGGISKVYDINGNLNATLGCENGTIYDNIGGTLTLFNDGITKQRVILSTDKTRDAGYMNLYDANVARLVFIAKDSNGNAGIFLYNGSGVLKSYLTETLGKIGDKYIATEDWVTTNFVHK